MLRYYNIESNLIKHSGCEYLCKADWKSLTTLYLGHNQIQAAGSIHFTKTDWKNLNKLELCASFIIQGTVKLEVKAATI